MKVSVNWLKDYVAFKPPFESVADRLTMAGLEVEKVTPVKDSGDMLFEVEITSNRPDWLSHIGVAREIAAVENLKLKMPVIETNDTHQRPKDYGIDIKDPGGCPYYSGILIEGVEMNETPLFMRERLEAVGLRCINLLVDITNFVLLETGQPLHVFDADLIQGKKIIVRKAKDKEKFTAINGDSLELNKNDLVIADAKVPIALAGVMGGKDSEVTERTRNIFLESAYFDSRSVRRSSQHHGLQSDSSYRFERTVDPQGVDFARQRALYFINKYAKPRYVSTVLRMGTLPKQAVKKIHLKSKEIERVLGLTIKSSQVTSCLSRLGLDVSQKGTESWDVNLPSFRSDLIEPVDLIEEVARIYGFDNIPSTLPSRPPIATSKDAGLVLEKKTRDLLTGFGLFETITFSLVENRGVEEEALKSSVELVNPQNKKMRWLRQSFLASFLNVIKHNYDHGATSVPIFEIAHLYSVPKGKKTIEESHVGFALAGTFSEQSWMDKTRDYSFYDLKGMVISYLESVGCADVRLQADSQAELKQESSHAVYSGDTKLGYFGAVSDALLSEWGIEKDVYCAELNLDLLKSRVQKQISLEAMPKYPATSRDLAVVVAEDIKAGEVEEQIKSLNVDNGLIRKIEVFDIFRGGRVPEGYKNIAFRITYQSYEKTLVSEDIQKIHAEIGAKIADHFKATFQS